MMDRGEVEVSFRRLVRGIPSTTYATHGLYYYPARFIPHVIRYVLEEYSSEGWWVFDPFAGSGSVAIECSLTGRNYVVWDLNPMLGLLVRASTYTGRVSPRMIAVDLGYSREYLPRWRRIGYWHPPEFLEALSRAWGYYHYEVPEELKPLAAIPLLRVTRYFSYSDTQVAKLYRSRRAAERVERLLGTDWRRVLEERYRREVLRVARKLEEYRGLGPRRVEGEVRSGVDSLSAKLGRDVEVMLTSPPYLQAQEYIRSHKLELYWLGYGEDEVRRLQRLEIPYREPPGAKVHSELYEEYRGFVESLGHPGLLRIYDAYFQSLAQFLDNNHTHVTRYMAIFVGPVKIRGARIPIDRILREHLEHHGWTHIVTLKDKIAARKLFKTAANPATRQPDPRTPAEHLLVMKAPS